ASSLLYPFLFLEAYAAHRALHSFPTRRSSDLVKHDLADGLARLGTARLTRAHHRAPLLLEPLPQQLRLGGLAGSVATLEGDPERSEEHTSELQSRENLVCRLLLEKKKQQQENS